MTQINTNYQKLPGSYLFAEVGRRAAAFAQAHPDKSLIRLGIGDVTLPLVLPPTLAGYLLLHVLDPKRLWKSLPFFRACSPQSCSLRRILRARAQTPAPYRQEYPAGSMAAGCARRCRCWKAPTSCWSKQAPRQMLRMHRAPSGI